MTEQNRALIEGLEKRLLWYREEASAEEFDADEVDAICTMLCKLSPEQKPRRTKEEAYQNILRQIDLEGEDPGEDGEDEAIGKEPEKAGPDRGKRYGNLRFFRKRKALMRAAAVAIVAVGVLTSLNMVSYARENKSLFTMILERVGVLKVVKDETAEDTEAGLTKSVKEFYDSWAELDRETKEKISVPGYIPQGYSLYGIKRWNLQDREILKAEYYDQGSGHLLIAVTLWKDNEDHYRETLADEQVCTLLDEYSKGNTFYYAYEDEYICIVYAGGNSYRIEGNIALEEMVKIGEGL